MSSPTWTPDALSAEQRRLTGTCWRLVEAQHRVSTLKLVDSLDEQALLERLIEQTKPPVPPECRHLHYLLSTPFRYGSVYPHGSRFRRAGMTPGVYYASRTAGTAVAEMTFHRLLFFADSPNTPWPANAAEFTAFSVRYAGAGIDLTAPPLSRDETAWMNWTNYEFLSGARRCGAGCRGRGDPLSLGARSGRGDKRRTFVLQGIHATRAGGTADLAHPARTKRGARGVRVSRGAA